MDLGTDCTKKISLEGLTLFSQVRKKLFLFMGVFGINTIVNISNGQRQIHSSGMIKSRAMSSEIKRTISYYPMKVGNA
jgi:hypothetical protein